MKDKKEMKKWVKGGVNALVGNNAISLSDSGQKFVMIRKKEEGDTKGGLIIPEDKFKEFVEFQRRWAEGKSVR